MRAESTYRTNCGLFGNRYLAERLPETEAWDEVDESELREAYDELREVYDEVRDRWERETERGPGRDGSRSEETFVRSVLRTLDIPLNAEETTDGPRRRPGSRFFESANATRDAADRREGGGDWDENGVAVVDVRGWGRSSETHGRTPVGDEGRTLDTPDSDEHERDFESSGYRIHVFLRQTTARWAVFTNGTRWRLYRATADHRLDSYYEIDLPTLLETGDLEAFKYFYLFFRREAFLRASSGDCFLDDAYDAGTAFAKEAGSALRSNVFEAMTVLADGFLRHPGNDLGENDLDLIHDASLGYLYRLVFVLYAESAEREFLDTDDERYGQSGGLHSLKREVAENLDGTTPQYRGGNDDLSARIDGLFERIDWSSESQDIPEDDRSVSAYDGGLFGTDHYSGPDESESEDENENENESENENARKARFLADHRVGDAALAKVVGLLTRRENGSGDGKTFIDYSSLDVRALGSIYEDLLEFELAVADEPLALDGDEYVNAAEDDEVTVSAGDTYLTTGSGERKATGSYYTPEYVVEYVVENTLEPLVAEIRSSLDPADPDFAERFAQRVFDLQILDPAMGSGHFLTSVVEYLARKIIDAQATQAARHGLESLDSDHDVAWARRRVVRRCLYGIDCNPLAVELAKASLRLRTLSAERPLTFLDHHLQTGDALVGSDIEEIAELEFGMGKETEAKMEAETETTDHEFEHDEHRRRLAAMANVHTAREFGLKGVPDDAFERMAGALDDRDEWERLSSTEWFESAQSRSDADGYFHWKLEFPEVFDDAANHGEASGFDAVVGNPPWVATAGRADISANIDADLRTYLEDAFEATENQFDLYVAFYEQFVRLSSDGRVGIVVPDAILAREQNQPIRAFVLANASLSRIVRVGTAFDGVETGAVVLVSGGTDSDVRCADATDTDDLSALSYDAIPQRVFEEQNAERFLVYLDETTRSILAEVEAHPPLETHVEISRGEEISKRADFLHDGAREGTRPIAPGGAVVPYGIDRGELRHVERPLVAKDEANYRSPKLVFRQTSDSLVGTYDDADLATVKSAYNLHSKTGSPDELKHVLGVLDSPLANFYHHYKHAAYRSVFPQINQSTFGAFPMALDGGPDRRIVEAVEERLELTAERIDIDLNVGDALGRYEDGRALGEIPSCRPAKGVRETMLAATTKTWPNLRVGTVETERRRNSVVISANVRYKPSEDAVETDRWGYAETDPIPALEFAGLDDELERLVEAFVPYAVSKADGFAEFRATATKTMSPLDRLRELTLPRLGDVERELREFVAERTRAAELDRRIANVERTIHERVCDLYGIPDDERDSIWREFGDD